LERALSHPLPLAKLTITELMTKLRLKDRQEVVKGVMAWVEEGVLDEVEGEEDMFEVLEYAKADEDMRARPVAQGESKRHRLSISA
jgi:hypothetical protein